MNIRYGVSVFCLLLLSAGTCVSAEFDSGSLAENIQIHGFASQGYLTSDQNNYYAKTEEGSFEFNEFGLNIGIDPSERLRVAIQVLSRDLGEFGNNTVEVDWAYGQYRWRDWFGLQAGMLQIPWGLYNETRDLDFLRPWIFLPPGLYDEQSRDVYDAFLGIGVMGDMFWKPGGGLSYSFGYGEKTLDETSSAFSNEARNHYNQAELRIHEILGGKLIWETPLDGLRFQTTSGTYRTTFQGRTANHPLWTEQGAPVGLLISELREGKYVIFSTEYAGDSLALAVEYGLHEEKNRGDNESEEGYKEGYYASAAYRFTDWLECGMYYSISYSDRDDKSGKRFQEEGLPDYFAWQKELVLTTRFDLNDAWILKFEGHAINGVANLRKDDNPDGFQEDSFLFAVKTTFSF